MLQTGTVLFTIFGSKIIIAARNIHEEQIKLNTALIYLYTELVSVICETRHFGPHGSQLFQFTKHQSSEEYSEEKLLRM